MDNLKRMMQRRSYRAKDGAEKMKALVYEKSGKMAVADNIKVPKLSTTQVLVRVHCASLNHVDYKRPEIPFLTKDGEPVGLEFVGTIEKLGWKKGDHVHLFPFAIGDVVFGMSYGTIAEYVVAEAEKIAFKLDCMDDEQAAAFPVSGLGAFQSLKYNKFTDGQVITVIGAADGTGCMYMKQAKLMGASKVVGVCHPEQEEFVLTNGADEVKTYDQVEEVVAESDMIVDLVSDPNKKGGENPEPQFYDICKPLRKKGSRFIAVNANKFDLILKLVSESIGFNVQRPGYDTALVTPKAAELLELVRWFEEGKLDQPIDSVIPFEEEALLAGFEKLKSGLAQGKLVVRVNMPRR